MLKITIVAVGKLKEKHWREAQEEYLTRLSPFAKVVLVEVSAEPFGASTTPEQAKREEALRIGKRIPADARIVALDERGRSHDSASFARFLKDGADGGGHLAFIIGGTAGLDAEILRRADERLSLSPLTFPHEMARIVLIEQIYRGATILTGKRYHY